MGEARRRKLSSLQPKTKFVVKTPNRTRLVNPAVTAQKHQNNLFKRFANFMMRRV